MDCINCKKPIVQSYLKVGRDIYHPECFRCGQCRKVIEGAYQEYKGKFYHPHCYREKVGLVCSKCGRLLDSTWVEWEGKKYHPQCRDLKCRICGRVIAEDYVYDQDGKYHQQCFFAHKAPRCSVCDQPIQGTHLVDGWGNRAHSSHGRHPTETCEYCGRIISPVTSNGSETYNDGRLVCGICTLTAVHGGSRLQNAQERVRKLLTSPPPAFLDIPHPVPLQLVDTPGLKKLAKTSAKTDSRGFTRSNIIYENKKRIKITHTIYILYGLPQIQFEAILAHEMLHTWLNHKEITLPEKEMEGFCNLGAALVFQQDSSPYARLMLENMEKNPDRVYGEGYRQMKRKLQLLGWQQLRASLVSK